MQTEIDVLDLAVMIGLVIVAVIVLTVIVIVTIFAGALETVAVEHRLAAEPATRAA